MSVEEEELRDRAAGTVLTVLVQSQATGTWTLLNNPSRPELGWIATPHHRTVPYRTVSPKQEAHCFNIGPAEVGGFPKVYVNSGWRVRD